MSDPARQLLTTLSTLRTRRRAARVPVRWLRVWRVIVANPAATCPWAAAPAAGTER